MLYVYYGEDIDAARKKVQATVGSLLAKNPDALYFRITSDVLAEYNFDELTGSQGLFKNEYVVVLDTLLSTKGEGLPARGAQAGEEVLINLEKIAAAPHPFFLLDGKLLAPVRKKLEKHAEKIHEFESKNAPAKLSFNTFSLTDALGEKNVKKLWTLFREAKSHGVSDEEIHGILFWMFKSLSLAAQSQSAEDAGMKPYPFSKAKGFLKNFSSRETLGKYLREFALLPQYARRNGTLLEIELERFILSLR
ncbi:MAG: hypothetical protein JKX80_01995 [Candidatus Pacebacteria bacterium]|nr:hypothetical protein [Candidatus Paceibacterota bacterium]